MDLAVSFPFLTIGTCLEIYQDHDSMEWDLWEYLEEVETCVKSEDYDYFVDELDV